MSKRFVLAVGAVALLGLPSAAFSQAGAADDADARELLAYRLTLPTLNKVAQATRNLSAAIKNDPRYKKQQALEAEIKKLEEKEEQTEADAAQLEKLLAELDTLETTAFSAEGAKTLSGMAAQFQREPIFAKSLADAGLSPREYATFLLAYFQAGMIHGMMKSGLIKEVPKDLAATVNMENVKFIAEHEAELAAFGQEMEAMNPPR